MQAVHIFLMENCKGDLNSYVMSYKIRSRNFSVASIILILVKLQI
uniref:Uncharacterized protein n=1 Tax=Triticum urartu TaxID=4572 RepID=A0A8R7PS83_TRIUA